MSFNSTAVFIDLMKELAYNSKLEFQAICYEILIDLYPDLIQTEHLGVYDKIGVDFYLIDTRKNKLSNLYQCKGFQEEFGTSQLNQCLKSIEKYRNSGQKGEKYFLIINKKIKDVTYFRVLEKELDKLVIGNQIKSYKIFDIVSFLNHLYEEYKLQIIASVKKHSKYFQDQYISILGNEFNVFNVPFWVDKRKDYNPLQYISVAGINRKAEGRLEKGRYMFLISEFGFGKTTLLFNLFNKLIAQDMTPIYIPVGALPSNGLSSEGGIVRSITELMVDSNIGHNNLLRKFKRGVFQNILKNSSNIVLLFDGLDEHKNLKNLVGLEYLFNSLAMLKPLMIFSMRKEFWDERQIDFQEAIGKNRKMQNKLMLSDWEDTNILEFIDGFIEKKIKVKQGGSYERILDFKKKIEVKGYSEYFGDIPKRPLFLQMIIQDIYQGTTKRNLKYSISVLYRKYIFHKIKRDLKGSFTSFVPERGIDNSLGLLAFSERIFAILENISGKMAKINNGKIIIENRIKSSNVNEFIAEFNLKEILDLLLHSVLVSDQERRDFDFSLKFAHFSFLEYFLARFILKNIDDEKWAQCKYESSLWIFINSLIREPEFEHCEEKVRMMFKI